jgi:hypothetical protein
MGGTQFEITRTGNNVKAAFNEAQDDCRYDHGHSGYSGTIAEKDGWREFKLKPGIKPELVMEAIHDHERESVHVLRPFPISGVPVELPKAPNLDKELLNPHEAEVLYATYDDKWGAAVALKHDGENKWLFFGWASC